MSGWWMPDEAWQRVEKLIPVLMQEDENLSESIARGRAEYIIGWGCCEKARPINCVCAWSTDCPEHGQRHHGSHE